ncbi:MAG: 50S ribosomal protein L9 [Micavibrio aeruginosavorus]|uniref:Large ribosomal subunit protein bL9 n=1 Tax=Micavibrio aeruginosavorus TaxID=349221 RepID=A0A2W5A256_9BACT|nr:MAG: 50S ribosomal protein L9 [Micavibrio aeruginosavorus]
MATQLILLERVENLGAMGDLVTVKPGYARNFLLPQNKALRATKENIAYYEAQKAHLQKLNAEKKGDAEKSAKNVEGAKVVIIRQAAEGGQLFGSVTSRDIAEALSEQSGQTVTRGQVALNQNFKTIGLFNVDVILHPEVKAKITVNIARSANEAEVQAKTGKAVIADSRAERAASRNTDDANKAAMLEDSALAAEKAEEEGQAAE